jgi:transcription factor SPT20
LTCIQDRRLPGDLMDVFNEACCRYYNGKTLNSNDLSDNSAVQTHQLKFIGCLIVEIHDHRSSNRDNKNRLPESETKMKRIVMKPTAESIWTDITLLSEEWGFPWTEDIALEVEAQILVSRSS